MATMAKELHKLGTYNGNWRKAREVGMREERRGQQRK
jgi:hypothetical protein